MRLTARMWTKPASQSGRSGSPSKGDGSRSGKPHAAQYVTVSHGGQTIKVLRVRGLSGARLRYARATQGLAG